MRELVTTKSRYSCFTSKHLDDQKYIMKPQGRHFRKLCVVILWEDNVANIKMVLSLICRQDNTDM